MITSSSKVVYVAYPLLDKTSRIVDFEVMEITNEESIHDLVIQSKMYNYYNIKHWFATKDECENYIHLLRNNIHKLSMIDYYAMRFNLDKSVVQLNFRNLQKLTYYCNKYKKVKKD